MPPPRNDGSHRTTRIERSRANPPVPRNPAPPALTEADALQAAQPPPPEPTVDPVTPALDAMRTGQLPPQPGTGSLETLSKFDTRVEAAKTRLETAVRDELGFASQSVSLTSEQVRWVTARLDAETDADADTAATVDPIKRALWMKQPDFRALYDTCADNKREAMRLLGSQMLPLALRTIYELLTGASVRGKQVGLTMLLRSQGMLIDKQVRTDPDQLKSLLGMLRESRPPTIVEGHSTVVAALGRGNTGFTPHNVVDTLKPGHDTGESQSTSTTAGTRNAVSSLGLESTQEGDEW